MIKGVTHAHLGSIWYHSEPSDVPYSPNQFLGWDFFCHFLQQDSSRPKFFHVTLYLDRNFDFFDKPLMPVDKNKQAKRTVSDRKIRTVYLEKIQNILWGISNKNSI